MGLLLNLSSIAGAEKMYWTDSGTQKIQRANLDGTGVEDLLTGLVDLSGLALDVGGGKMYWTSFTVQKIQRANLDGTGVEDLLTGGGAPQGIALDVVGGKMYWIDGFTGKIRRANLDGTGVEDLVTGLSLPIGIALDVASGKMYWTDIGTTKIQRANLDGTGVVDILTSTDGLFDPSELALDVAIVVTSTGICTPGVVTVVVPNAGELIVANVNEATLSLGGAAPLSCTFNDADGDGDDDLVCKFAWRDLDLTGGSTEAALTGQMSDGRPITGIPSIRIFRCR
jgi:hypothetical protein